jgi:hypothetical protein
MASRKKSTVFRVTGLIRDQPDEALKTLVRATIDKHLSNDEKLQIETEITIVPSCYESNRKRTALVQFCSGSPAFLSELTNNSHEDWSVEMGDNDISFDRHFFGFTQLYMPAEEESVVAE